MSSNPSHSSGKHRAIVHNKKALKKKMFTTKQASKLVLVWMGLCTRILLSGTLGIALIEGLRWSPHIVMYIVAAFAIAMQLSSY